MRRVSPTSGTLKVLAALLLPLKCAVINIFRLDAQPAIDCSEDVFMKCGFPTYALSRLCHRMSYMQVERLLIVNFLLIIVIQLCMISCID